MNASPNQRVGEYVLDHRIAAGAFGEVWFARHHVWNDQIVAVKIPTDPLFLRHLQREGLAIHGLQHPGIVRALAFDPFAPLPYLAMEYVPGSSLRLLIQERSLSVADSVAVMRQVLSALGAAHAQGLVHRDIKPENILIHQDARAMGLGAAGMVKLTDFGLGRTSGAPDAAPGSIAYSASMHSEQGRELAGTLDYMAPEMRQPGQGPVDQRADLYACGVVLYEMLTGERPAGAELPSELNAKVPAWLDQVFRRSYARLDKRYPSVDQFIADLTRGGSPVVPTSATSSGPKVTFVPVPPVRARDGQCVQCNGHVGPGDQFCIHCGLQLVENVRRCPQCGAFPDPSDQYCIFCGQTLVPPRTVMPGVTSG